MAAMVVSCSWHTRKTAEAMPPAAVSSSSSSVVKQLSVKVHFVKGRSLAATHTIAASPRCTIAAIKAELQVLTGIPPSQQEISRGAPPGVGEGKKGVSLAMGGGLPDGARVLAPASRGKGNAKRGAADASGDGSGEVVFTMRVAPIDTALLMRRARRFRKFITYEAFKAEDEQQLARQRQARAQARLRKEASDEKKRRNNDEAFDKWLSRVRSDRQRAEKWFEAGQTVRLLEPLELTFEKESRRVKEDLEEVHRKLLASTAGGDGGGDGGGGGGGGDEGDDNEALQAELKKEQKRLEALKMNKRCRTVNPAEVLTVLEKLDRAPPSHSEAEATAGAGRSTALEMSTTPRGKNAVWYRVNTSDRWSVTIPGHKLVAAIVEEEEGDLYFS